tara:strand:- start:523 stop:1281 length:759 start_codon:yes stop_codon:yes gene_type:complete
MLEDKLLPHRIKKDTYDSFLKDYIRKNKEERRLQTVYLNRANELLGGVSIDTDDFMIKNAQKKRDKALEKIEEINKKLQNTQIHEVIIENILTARKSQNVVKRNANYKRKIKKEHKEQKDKIREDFYKRCKEGGRVNRQNKYFVRSSWRWLTKTDRKLPNYMRKNLREMPNNKGYIFRNIQYYGHLPRQKNQPQILFEKNRGVLRIHEITKTRYKIYEKQTKNSKKVLIKNEIRKENPFLKNELSLFDYIKK